MRVMRSGVLSALAAVILFTSLAAAQSDAGSITGFVRDPSGATVPRAKVVIRNEGTREERTIMSNESGYYVVANLAPGFYTVAAEATGFKKLDSLHNKLDANSTLSVDVMLQIGATTESVQVTASGLALQTESAGVEKLVTRGQIDALELNGRDPLFLVSLQPGTHSTTTMGDFSFSLTNGGYAIN